MKKIYSLFFAIFVALFGYSQALLNIDQTSPNSGIYKITYNDAANGWSFYNPNNQPIGVYLWINASEVSTNVAYAGSWNTLTEQLTWDGTNYSGTVNLNTHNFSGTGGVLPAGTTVNQLNFIFTEYPAGNGSHQTVDLKGTNYGFTPTTISTLGSVNVNTSNFKSFVSEGKLYTAKQGNLSIQVVDFSGRIIKTMNVKSASNGIELNLPKKGNYLLKVNDEVIKFAY